MKNNTMAGDSIYNLPERSIRLATIIRLRWIAVVGQLATVGFVHLWLEFPLPFAYCLAVISLSAWVNIYLMIRYPMRQRLSAPFALALLAYDTLQLALLLYLTGGIENPFAFLIIVPVIVSAATLSVHHTFVLGAITIAAITLLLTHHMPLPWYPGFRIQLPFLFKLAVLAAIVSSMVFLAFYAWRLAVESNQMSSALAATELVLAREQKLHALDGLAAAAAHELGTPLSTIVLVTKELSNDHAVSAEMREDFELLRSQADRCREILQKLTRAPNAQDPMHASLSALELIDEAASPYRERGKILAVSAMPPPPDADGRVEPEPRGTRQPGVIYGLGNLIENAVDFSRQRVDVAASWSANTVTIEVVDDGPGFPPELMDSLGDPYVTSRAAASSKRSSSAGGLGLGFFIAKSLLERSGATVSLSNRIAPRTGAIVTITWPRQTFERPAQELASAL